MNQSFYIASVGAQQQQQSLTVTSNNIANVNMHGYKAQRGRFSALIYQNMKAVEQDTVRAGVGGALWTTDTKFESGAAITTGLSQDYMIQGDGFFALVDLATREISLTRSGAFHMASLQRDSGLLDEEGNAIPETVYYLADSEGRFVLGKDGGMLEMTDPNEEMPVGVFDYPNYNGMRHQYDGRFLNIDKNGGLTLGTGKVICGALEASNVELSEEITKVIETQRAYTMALKMMTTSDEIESTINGLRG